MKQAVLIFPTQLFKVHPCLQNNREVFLIEEKRYFTDFKFHKKKLLLHRASMKAYQVFLESEGYKVHYLEFHEDWKKEVQNYEFFLVRPFDVKLEDQLPKNMSWSPSPAFLGGELKKSKRYLMGNFYKRQRKRMNIMVENGQPVGGKWSFDEDNRKKLPKNHQVPTLKTYSSPFLDEAISYVEKHFPDNPGDAHDFIYPLTHHDAESWLKDFLKERFELFGDYEDAISKEESFIYHSLLSPLLNIGLLTPQQVIDEVLKVDVPINSKEGFIRQVIGWREFILQLYLLEGETQRSSNFFHHTKKLPSSFYNGTTGIEPVDNVIKKVLKNAYCHHIERLMVLANFMNLSGYDPNEIYRWFMELFIDAYDWVMVPNVYGMATYADGGLMSTKPYISSSNYILKMSDFKKGEWCDTWNELFWNFLEKHEEKLKDNPRMVFLMKNLEKRRVKSLNNKFK